MSYAAQSDIENVYGSQSVIEWSNFTPGAGAVTAARITLALAWAYSQINNALKNGPYTVPIVGVATDPPVEMVVAEATLAGWWLWDTRGLHKTKEIQMDMQRKFNKIIGELSLIQMGRLPIGAQLKTTRSTAPRVRTPTGWK